MDAVDLRPCARCEFSSACKYGASRVYCPKYKRVLAELPPQPGPEPDNAPPIAPAEPKEDEHATTETRDAPAQFRLAFRLF